MKIEIRCDQPVEIVKLFGPTVFADLRVTADFARGAWIVERYGKDAYEEVAVIPAQLDSDFEDLDESPTREGGFESRSLTEGRCEGSADRNCVQAPDNNQEVALVSQKVRAASPLNALEESGQGA